jgi:hypothetical protein
MKHISETKEINGIIVHKYNIGCTNRIIYNAWEPSTITGNHSTITTFDGKWYGRIGTNPDKSMFSHLEPCSIERHHAVNKAYQQQYDRAIKYIKEAYPELKETVMTDRGEIEINLA